MNTATIRPPHRHSTTRGLTLISARALHQLDEHGEAWNGVTAKSEQGLPMSSFAWTRSHLEHFVGPETNWIVLFAYEGDMLVGVLPLMLGRDLRHFGRVVAKAFSSDHTICADMSALPGRERECIEFFLECIDREAPGVIDIEFPFITDSSPTYQLLIDSWPSHNTFARDWGQCGWLPCVGGFSNYQLQVDRELKKNLRQLNKRLTDTGRVSVSIVKSDDAEPSHFQRFVRLEPSGWKGNRERSICSSGLTLSFYRVLTSRLQDLGWLEWHFMEIDGKDIAAQLAVRTGSTLCLVKTAFDENYRRFAPGKLLFEQTLKRAFEAPEIERVNCLGYGELYRPWNLSTHRFVEVHFIRKGIAGALFRHFPLHLKSIRRGNNDRQSDQQVSGE